jgi:hypothetical protein
MSSGQPGKGRNFSGCYDGPMTDKPSMFLTVEELAELTGIKIGKNKQTREQLQAAELTRLGIPHYVNIAGRVIVARAIIESRPPETPPPRKRWEPNPSPSGVPLVQPKPPPSVASERDEVIEEYIHAGMKIQIYRDAGLNRRPTYFAVVINLATNTQSGSLVEANSYPELRAAAKVRAERKAVLWQRRMERAAAENFR